MDKCDVFLGHVDAAAAIYMQSRELWVTHSDNLQPQNGIFSGINVTEDFTDLHRYSVC